MCVLPRVNKLASIKNSHSQCRICHDMSLLFGYFSWSRPSFSTSPSLLSGFSRQIAVVEGTGHVLRQVFAQALGFLPVRQVTKALIKGSIDYAGCLAHTVVFHKNTVDHM